MTSAAERIGLGEPIAHNGLGVTKRLSAARRLGDWRGCRVLDVDCGNGAYTESIAQDAAFTVGVDVERRWLETFCARQRADTVRVPVALGAAEHLPFREGEFHAVFCIETLEHVRDERRTLGELLRVLRPGGSLILTVPNKWYLFETHGLAIGPITGNRLPFVSWLPRAVHSRIAAARIYRVGDLAALLGSAGFSDVRTDHVMPPLDKLGSGVLRTVLGGGVAVDERTALRHFGVSIVAVGQKPE